MLEADSSQSKLHKKRFAAIDMGSNSFQLQVSELCLGDCSAQKDDQEDIPLVNNCWTNLLYEKARVQLAAGLDQHNRLTEPAMEKAIQVLVRFDQLLEPFKPFELRVVGTKALRAAINSDDFVQRVLQRLNYAVEIIDGVEEARLIYHGVATSQVSDITRLVIDVGGGSTEFIVGQGNHPLSLDSTSLGCVTSQLKFFEDGVISAKQLKLAETQASLKLLPLRHRLRSFEWHQVVGCSGVFEALYEVQQWLFNARKSEAISGISQQAPVEKKILSLEGLEAIHSQLLNFKNTRLIEMANLGDSRKRILPSALAIVLAIFRTLNITQLELSEAALKDGVIFELHNEQETNKTRQQTLRNLMKQYKVDGKQALRVLASVTEIWQQLAEDWILMSPRNQLVLSWAALLHEIGVSVSPHNFPAHGAYLIGNTELPGFNKSQQKLLAVLIAGQSGNIPTELLHDLSEENKADSWRLLIALRLAKIIRSNREESPPAKLTITASGIQLSISILASSDPDLDLLWAALVEECSLQKQVGYEIALQGNLPFAT